MDEQTLNGGTQETSGSNEILPQRKPSEIKGVTDDLKLTKRIRKPPNYDHKSESSLGPIIN